jgi:predicted lysophospholipase L1 biosynthesis ABC-type transport system permease subunit
MGTITGKKIAGFALGFIALAAISIVTGHLADAQIATQFADGAPLMYAGIRG